MSALHHSRLFDLLLDILSEHTEGISEHALIKALGQRDAIQLSETTFTDSLELFRTHFFVYNALYSLRDHLWGQRLGHLEISGVNIRLLPYQPGVEALAQQDSLRDYYLDLSILESTTRDDVDNLLRNFWKEFDQPNHFASGGLRAKALQTLGLSEPVTYPEIKRRYRRLAMQHHPDRGGSQQTLQEINSAMEVLKQAYRP